MTAVEAGRAGTSAREPRPARTLRYLPSLDGLRALAVMSVLLYHADLPWIPGGFLGVDVFFVISGYLITSLLLAESQRAGSVNLRQFWLRRARRLLPALFAMLAIVAVYALLFVPDAVSELRGDLVAAFGYVENWWLILRNQSYFQAAGRPPLLESLWSLAVEEQFYLVWPLVFLAGMALSKRRPARMLVGIVGGIIASTLLMAFLYHPLGDPSRVYYGTDTRAAPLLVGAALAIVWSPWRLSRVTGPGARILLDAIGLAALGGLVWSVLNVNEFEPNLYRGGFLGVALLSAIVIAVAAHPAAYLFNRLLSLPVLHWIGVRSYAIYLWHLPVYLVTRPHLDVGFTGLPLLALRVGITFALAELSYVYVERPIRAGVIRRHVERLRTAPRRERARLARVTVLSSGGVAVIMVAVAIGLVTRGPAPLPPGFTSQLASGSRTYVTPPSSSTTTTTAPPVAPSVIAPTTTTAPVPPPVAVGDSVMLGAASALQARIPGIVVDAAVSRHFGEVIPILTADRNAGRLGNVVIVHMGTNGLVTAGEFDGMMNALRGVRRVVVVNLKVPRRWEGQDNDVLAAEVQRYPNAVLVDWHGQGGAHPEFFWNDGIHLRPPGAAFYADLIARAMG